MKNLITLLVVVLIAIIGYNYFAGTAEEKETSREIINTAKDLGAATWDLLKSEKEKFDEGKYDGVMEEAKGLFNNLRDAANRLNDQSSLDRVEELDQRREDLREKMDQRGGMDPELRQEMKKLLEETETLMQQMNQEGS
jgi:hypothetical protein